MAGDRVINKRLLYWNPVKFFFITGVKHAAEEAMNLKKCNEQWPLSKPAVGIDTVKRFVVYLCERRVGSLETSKMDSKRWTSCFRKKEGCQFAKTDSWACKTAAYNIGS